MTLGWLFWVASLLPAPVQERTCLAATVYLEARDQSLRGQYAVAEVALRRRDRGVHGDTVCSVVTRSRQFAPGIVSRNVKLKNLEAWNVAWEIAGQSLERWRRPPPSHVEIVPGADHFIAHNRIEPPAWARGEPVAVIDDHSFYRVGL